MGNLPKILADRLQISAHLRWIEDWWFDITRSVQTSGNAPPRFDMSKIVGEIRDSLTCIPIRPVNARVALRDLPIKDHSQYTFIDMGSGKGRMLFLAAEHSFRKVQGLEFVIDLHERACDNIKRYRHRKQKCAHLESIHGNAADFEFPSGNLVVCIFNPFGPEVLDRVLTNLSRSIDSHPRHVVILLIWPIQSQLVARMRGIRVYKQTRRHHIYQTAEPEIGL